MKTNKNKPSKNKRPSVSSDILTAIRRKASPHQLHHNQLNQVALPSTAGDRYQVDSVCLDMSAVLPGAPRELGQAYLNLQVDSATGLIVSANIEFYKTREAPCVAKCIPYRPHLKGATESAFSRLLRRDPSN
jgi:hypothetical protein